MLGCLFTMDYSWNVGVGASHNVYRTVYYVIGALIHDGLFVERKESEELGTTQRLPDNILREAEIFIKEQTGFRVWLSEKSLAPTAQDLAILDGPKVLKKMKSDFHRCVYLLSREAKLHKLKRMDLNVYRPHPSIPGVYVPAEEYSDFINKTLCSSPYLMSVKNDDLSTWMRTQDHRHFELLCVSKFANVIAFRNGCFDLESLQFSRYVQNSKGEWKMDNGKVPPMTQQFYDREFIPNQQNLATARWDKLISTQIKKRSVCKVCGKPGHFSVEGKVEILSKPTDDDEEDEDEEDKLYTTFCADHAPATGRLDLVLSEADMFEILVGRLFYSIKKHDNWQVMLFMKGDSNSGKSTLLNIVTQMFPEGSVGCIGSTTETNFGLQNLFNKRLVLFPDMSSGVAKNIPKEMWQSMISGEKVSIAIKNKGALTDKAWLVPIAGAGNQYPGWKETSGAVNRRLACFLWSEPILERDPSLEQKIIEIELITILVRCAIAYRAAAKRFVGAGFWEKIAPKNLQESKKLVAEYASPLSAFLLHGNEYYQVVFEEGASTAVGKFEAAYANHCKYVLKFAPASCKLDDDRHPLTALGYISKKTNICKLCDANPANKKTCGDHYLGGKNRKQGQSFLNMRLLNKKEQAAEQVHATFLESQRAAERAMADRLIAARTIAADRIAAAQKKY